MLGIRITHLPESWDGRRRRVTALVRELLGSPQVYFARIYMAPTLHSLGLVMVCIILTKGDMIIVRVFSNKAQGGWNYSGKRPDLIGITVRIEGRADVTALNSLPLQALIKTRTTNDPFTCDGVYPGIPKG